MKNLKILIPGQKVDNLSPDSTAKLTLEESYVLGASTRGEMASDHIVELDDNKVVEFVFSDDTVWLGDQRTLDEVFPGSTSQMRDIRANVEDDTFVIPTELYAGEQNRSGLVRKISLKLVKIFTKKAALAPLVKKLAAELEEKQLENRSGLYRLTSSLGFKEPTFGAEDKYLLFIHGTASSTLGSFGELKGSTVWNFIQQSYGDNVLAFEHETLTKSPLQNVRELVDQLPPKATLTLLSHSRGGLVGDVLNRFCSNDPTQRGFSSKEKNYLSKHKREDDLQLIEEIEKALLLKEIKIDKFIRVACTASGTTLASRRLDIYFNVIFNVIGLATGQAANPVYAAFKDLIAALIESKDDASVLPGLEVQNPRSPFNQMLNNANPDALINNPLIVISGDARMSLRWQGLKVVLSNLFFWDDNDFVVDTRSMYNGAKRAQNMVQYFFDEGTEVSHFNYFRNDKTQNALLLALKNSDNQLIPGFSRLETRTFTEAEIRNINLPIPGGSIFHDTVSGNKPIVVLVPGIMGSTLSVSNKLIWINFLGFAVGSLNRLQHSVENNKNVKASGLVGSSYKKLAEYLKKEYDVVTFPFDWRISLEDSAAIFKRKIEQLMDHGQPIKLIGHSMGGVLIRDFMINHDDTWNKLRNNKDFRLIFLGAPLGGSFRIPYVLFGLDSIIKKLDFIDFTNTQKDLLKVFCKFPGILNLLPLNKDADNDFARKETWEKMRIAFGDKAWPIPENELLKRFETYRENILTKLDSLDYSLATYIAGQGAQTISGYQITNREKRQTLEFLATREGDESVTWDSGIPKAMTIQNNVYYSDVTHGELANDPKLFAAITDILSTGYTTKLKRTRPVVRSLEREFTAKEVFDFDLSPEGVEKTLLGLSTEKQFHKGDIPITVSVSNGDLKYAMYPLVVGHFERDGILSAEKSIDAYLGGELSRRHQLGLYPGEIGTSEIITTSINGFQGAIIVGLGRQGLLTEFRLTSSVEQGVSKYLAQLNSTSDRLLPTHQNRKRIGISVLLVGSHYGGLRLENSIRAIIQGVQNANSKVQQIYTSPNLIESIEFVELYKDRALACVKAISSIEKEENRSLNIFTNGTTIKRLVGWRERLPIDNTTEWWTRITVQQFTEKEQIKTKQSRHLRFAISTDAARVEERTLTTVDESLIDMLQDLSKNDDWSPELAKSIFELIIPNDFKDQVKRQSNINWILDKYTAAFPWELLQDNISNSRPLSVNAGMIRQLATGDYRTNVNPITERTAIVIGDPELRNPSHQLPAALEEGVKVAELLTMQGFEVNRLLKSSAPQILQNLYSRNYKIVHLAGHGIFNNDPELPTGMLIGPNSYLTPGHIDQMSGVPELVFVNCCYLGQSDSVTEEFQRDRFRLAANIGTQLIEIGVKAVVVAGWAVNDSAALDFAECFYEAMFEGCEFGEAVKKARKSTYEKYGTHTNTWGAYQCYGDPFYQLSPDPTKSKVTFEFIIPEEAELELSNLLNRVERGEYDPESIQQTMDAIDLALTKANIRSGRITELQAFLYSSLYKYELAMAKFNELWKEEKATFSFAATEKYCNTMVKWQALNALKEMKSGNDPEVISSAIKAINDAIEKLKALNTFGETVERLNLLGSAYKRLALISSGKGKLEAYQQSALYYHKAMEASGAKTKFYPMTNWLSIEKALENVSESTPLFIDMKNQLPPKDVVYKILSGELEHFQLKGDQEREYWDWIAGANILLCQRLLGDQQVTYESIRSQYTHAWSMIGSEGQKQAEIEHLEFLEDALKIRNGDSNEELDIVRKLKVDLQNLL